MINYLDRIGLVLNGTYFDRLIVMETCPTEKTFKRIYTDYSDVIQSTVACFIKDTGVAEDVFQEIFLKVWKLMSTYDESRGGVYAWLNSITVSTCIDHIRRSRRHVDDRWLELSPDCLPDPQAHPDKVAVRNDLSTLSVRLAHCLYEVIVMIYFRGHTQEEAAKLLKLPLGTLKSRQRRAVQIIRTIYLQN